MIKRWIMTGVGLPHSLSSYASIQFPTVQCITAVGPHLHHMGLHWQRALLPTRETRTVQHCFAHMVL